MDPSSDAVARNSPFVDTEIEIIAFECGFVIWVKKKLAVLFGLTAASGAIVCLMMRITPSVKPHTTKVPVGSND